MNVSGIAPEKKDEERMDLLFCLAFWRQEAAVEAQAVRHAGSAGAAGLRQRRGGALVPLQDTPPATGDTHLMMLRHRPQELLAICVLSF
ncbi:unnamed protein product [Colias eurytheme]|nr:unnamed protein product [Colias eurytheme]